MTLPHYQFCPTDISRTFHLSKQIHILLKYTWNIYQDISYTGTRIHVNKFKKD